METGSQLDEVLMRIHKGSFEEARRVIINVPERQYDGHYWVMRSLIAAATGDTPKAERMVARAKVAPRYSPVDHADLLWEVALIKLWQGEDSFVREGAIETIVALYEGRQDRLPSVKILEGLQATLKGDYTTAARKHQEARAEWDAHPESPDPSWVELSTKINDFHELVAIARSGKVRHAKGRVLIHELLARHLFLEEKCIVYGLAISGRTGYHVFRTGMWTLFRLRRLIDRFPL